MVEHEYLNEVDALFDTPEDNGQGSGVVYMEIGQRPSITPIIHSSICAIDMSKTAKVLGMWGLLHRVVEGLTIILPLHIRVVVLAITSNVVKQEKSLASV